MKNLNFALIGAFLFLLANPHLTRASDDAHKLAFHLPQILEGQWWRFFTASFLHYNWQHLIFGFFTTLGFLLMLPMKQRIPVFVIGVIGATAIPLILTPATHHQYLMGVSGTAHGLVVACVWPLLKSPHLTERILSWSSLITVYLKVIYESYTGILVNLSLTSEYSIGFCKDAHLGGVLSITLYYLIHTLWKKHLKASSQAIDPTTTQPIS